MDTLTVEFDDLMTRFDEIVERVREGHAVRIHRNGHVNQNYTIRITTDSGPPREHKRVFGLKAAGNSKMAEDFNDPLPDSFWLGPQ